jgi:asparagine synthase (glutamine-hydrolysing)
MCGITAIYAYGDEAPPVAREELEAINERLRPRGPDAGGTWISDDGRVGLGSRRLAIIDLTPDGNQPMSDVAGELMIVFNGEIYNHRELRTRLEGNGVRFHSSSDTEVLLELYRAHGERMVELLRGMFGFCIWDKRERRMFVARDPYGIKPLYAADDGRTLRIASTVKALLAGGALPRTHDPAGVAGFHLLGSVPEPFTVYESIRAVEAGTSFFVSARGVERPRRYYAIGDVYRRAVDQKNVARLVSPPSLLRELVTESICYHLVSDVPVGAFLSAGIDSTTIVALAQLHASEPLRTVNVLFDLNRGGPYDESALAAAFARERGTQHAARVVTREEFLADLPRLFDAMDQPTIDGVNSWFVSKAAAELGLKVALSGLGGDELFGSYPSFRQVPRIVRAASLAARLPLGLRTMTAGVRALQSAGRGHRKLEAIPRYGATYAGAYLVKRGLFMPEELGAVMDPDAAAEGLRRLGLLDRIGALLDPDPGTPFGRVATLESSLYMRNQLLRDTDWASMAHSLEVRTPLVDASLLRQLAPLLNDIGEEAKSCFAEAARPPLPKSISERPKSGFMTPIAAWLALPDDGTPTRVRSWASRVMEQF